MEGFEPERVSAMERGKHRRKISCDSLFSSRNCDDPSVGLEESG
jgi:hypothetical protein